MIRNRLTSVQRIEAAKDLIDDKNVLKAVLSEDIEKLQTTLEEIDNDSFNKAVDTIMGAKHVYISAMRTSKYIAEFFGFYLGMMMGNVHVVCETGASEVFEELLRIGPGDVFIGFTFPRYSSRAIKAMRFAKARGAKIIGITHSKASPYYRVAEICLFAKSDMVSFLDSMVAPMSLVNALTVAIGIRCREALSDTFKRLDNVWSEFEIYEKNEN